jgi:hypothetical protein
MNKKNPEQITSGRFNFGQRTKKSTNPTQSFSCPKKLIKITKTRE